MFRRYVDENWFWNALIVLSFGLSLGLIVLYASGWWLRPTDHVPAERTTARH